jgi:hypothetical protein
VQKVLVNGNVTYTNVTLNQLNASGLLCSIATNFPWFWTMFMIAVYVICLFLFSYLNSVRLLTVSNSLLFAFATILLSYGFITPMLWMGTLGMLVFAIALLYMTHGR